MSEEVSQLSQSSRRGSAGQARPRCSQCGSRRFRRDPNSGFVVCREGHILQGFREEEAHDDQDFVALGQRRQVRKGGRSRKAKERKEVWKDGRARFLGFECLQLILRLQLKALRLEWPQLPPEVGAIARDLWALYVSTFRDLTASPYDENFDFVVEQIRVARDETELPRRSRSRSHSRNWGIVERARQLEEEQSKGRAQTSQEEARLEQELREMAGIPERTTGTESPMAGSPAQMPPSIRFPRSRKNFGPLVTLVTILYLALITARVPVMWSDLRVLIAAGKIPYLSVIQVLPSAMTAKLSKDEIRKLDEEDLPTVTSLQECTSQLALQLNRRFNVQFPELNVAAVLWRCVRSIGLPPTFYQPAISICNFVGLPLTAVPQAAVSDPWSLLGCLNEHTARTHDRQRILPPLPSRFSLGQGGPAVSRCTIIMAALILVAKMEYGLDDFARHQDPPSSVESPVGTPSFELWVQALSEAANDRCDDPLFAFELTKHPADLSDQAIDALLDHSEATYFQQSQPNVRSHWRKSNLHTLFAGLPDPTMPATRVPSDQMGRPATQSLIEHTMKVTSQLQKRLYRMESAASHDASPSLRPASDHSAPASGNTCRNGSHPAYERIIRFAASILGLTQPDQGSGPATLAETVADLERILLRRLRQNGADHSVR